MSMLRWLILVGVVAGLQIIAAGQSSLPQNMPAQAPSNNDDAGTRTAPAGALSALAGMQPEGGENTSSDLPQIPSFLGGTGISSAFLPELERSNYLRGGVNIGGAYDDNPLLVTGGATSNTSVSIFPNISIEESSSRMRWKLGYAGGLTINQSLPNENQDSQNLNFDSQYRLSPHVNLRIAENFSSITGFFDGGNGSEVITGTGGPNASLITPLATQRSSFTTVETNYHFALNDLIGASGSFYDSHFSNPGEAQPTIPLANSQTASGSTFWLHRIVRGDWGGVSYRFDRITFNLGGGESLVHSFFAVNTLNLSNRLSLTGFVGPQYSDNQGLVPGASLPSQTTDWSLAGGVEGGWKNQRTSLSGGYSRNISDGGGVLGAVRLQNVHANFRRELAPGWAVAVNVVRGTNQSLIVPTVSSASSINLTEAGILLERNIGKSVGFRMGYAHDFQEQLFTAPNPTQDAQKNRVFVTLSYQWAKPLGM
jgi:hypothetical protein